MGFFSDNLSLPPLTADKGKTKAFHAVSQGLLSGRLVQTPAADCTVHCSRPYSPLQRTVQSIAEVCNSLTYKNA